MKRRPAQKKSKKKQKKEEAQVQETSFPIPKKNPDYEREKLRRRLQPVVAATGHTGGKLKFGAMT